MSDSLINDAVSLVKQLLGHPGDVPAADEKDDGSG